MTNTMDNLVLYLHLMQTLKDIKNQCGEEEMWQILELAVRQMNNETFNVKNVKVTYTKV